MLKINLLTQIILKQNNSRGRSHFKRVTDGVNHAGVRLSVGRETGLYVAIGHGEKSRQAITELEASQLSLKNYTPNSTGLCFAMSDRNGTLLFIMGDLITM